MNSWFTEDFKCLIFGFETFPSQSSQVQVMSKVTDVKLKVGSRVRKLVSPSHVTRVQDTVFKTYSRIQE